MSINNTDISFYTDCLIVEALLQEEHIKKTASAESMIMPLIDKIKAYVSAHIDPNDKAASLINIFGPGVIFNLFRSLNLGWLGLLLSLSMRVFNIDVAGIVYSIWDKLKDLIKDDAQISSNQIDQIVHSSVDEHVQPATPEEAQKAQSLLQKKSFDQSMRDARFVKLMMIDYAANSFTKQAGFFDIFSSKKQKTTNMLVQVLSWIFKVAVSSAGLMVAGDVVNKFLGRPNALDGSIKDGKPVAQAPVSIMPPTTQTKFKVKPSYNIEHNNSSSYWTENIPNNEGSIKQMLINFANDVYDGLTGKDNIIANTAGFQAILDRIVFFNRNAANPSLVWIPSEFKSKKQMVDYFIDDVAEKST